MVNLLLREEIYATSAAPTSRPRSSRPTTTRTRRSSWCPRRSRSSGSSSGTATGARRRPRPRRSRPTSGSSSRPTARSSRSSRSSTPTTRTSGAAATSATSSREGKPGIPPEVVEKAFSLNVGQLSQPFDAGDGFNVVQVAAKREAVERTFDQMKGSVLRRLKNERFQELTDEYIAAARARYDVEIDEAALASRPRSRPAAVRPAAPPGEEEHEEDDEMVEDIGRGWRRVIAWSARPRPTPPDAGVVDRIVAVVNDEVVTLSDVYELGADYVARRTARSRRSERCLRHRGRARGARLAAAPGADPPGARQARARRDRGRRRPGDRRDRPPVRAARPPGAPRPRSRRAASGGTSTARSSRSSCASRPSRVACWPRGSRSRDDEVKDYYQRTARTMKTPTAKLSGLGVGIPPGTTPEQEAEMVDPGDAARRRR